MKNYILFSQMLAVLTLAFMLPIGRLPAAQPDIEKASHPADGKIEDVSAVEDLMREHGLLGRILLIYEKELKDIEAEKGPSYSVLFKAANIVRDFVENYHEKLEEDYIFPRFEKSGKLPDLVKVLREQHSAGRKNCDEDEYQSGHPCVPAAGVYARARACFNRPFTSCRTSRT